MQVTVVVSDVRIIVFYSREGWKLKKVEWDVCVHYLFISFSLSALCYILAAIKNSPLDWTIVKCEIIMHMSDFQTLNECNSVAVSVMMFSWPCYV